MTPTRTPSFTVRGRNVETRTGLTLQLTFITCHPFIFLSFGPLVVKKRSSTISLEHTQIVAISILRIQPQKKTSQHSHSQSPHAPHPHCTHLAKRTSHPNHSPKQKQKNQPKELLLFTKLSNTRIIVLAMCQARVFPSSRPPSQIILSDQTATKNTIMAQEQQIAMMPPTAAATTTVQKDMTMTAAVTPDGSSTLSTSPRRKTSSMRVTWCEAVRCSFIKGCTKKSWYDDYDYDVFRYDVYETKELYKKRARKTMMSSEGDSGDDNDSSPTSTTLCIRGLEHFIDNSCKTAKRQARVQAWTSVMTLQDSQWAIEDAAAAAAAAASDSDSDSSVIAFSSSSSSPPSTASPRSVTAVDISSYHHGNHHHFDNDANIEALARACRRATFRARQEAYVRGLQDHADATNTDDDEDGEDHCAPMVAEARAA
jgi:hypothetical protein